MIVTKGIQKVTPVTHGVVYVAYGLRGPQALKDRCAEIAAHETKKLGYPVSTSAIMRKLIQDGVNSWGIK